MAATIGMYPGGPSPSGSRTDRRLPDSTRPTMGQLEELRARLVRARRRRARTTRLALGTLAALAIGVAAGWWLGTRATRTSDGALPSAAIETERTLADEGDRILRELWRMEALDRRDYRRRN